MHHPRTTLGRGPRRSARVVVVAEALDDIDEELLELADGTTKLATMGALLGLSEAELSERIDRLSHLGFLDGDADESNSCFTAPDAVRDLGREWAIDTLVDAAPPTFEDD